jgi:hypothetical protein
VLELKIEVDCFLFFLFFREKLSHKVFFFVKIFEWLRVLCLLEQKMLLAYILRRIFFVETTRVHDVLAINFQKRRLIFL